MNAPTRWQADAFEQQIRDARAALKLLDYREELPGGFTITARYVFNPDPGEARLRRRVQMPASCEHLPASVLERELAVARAIEAWERNEGPWPVSPEPLVPDGMILVDTNADGSPVYARREFL